MTITTVGIDLAKNVFAVHCVDQHGKTVLVKPKVSRAALPELYLLTAWPVNQAKMMQLMLRLSVKQFVARICGLYQ